MDGKSRVFEHGLLGRFQGNMDSTRRLGMRGDSPRWLSVFSCRGSKRVSVLSIAYLVHQVHCSMGSIALITNCIGYFSTSFTIEECRRFHLVAPVTKMVAGGCLLRLSCYYINIPCRSRGSNYHLLADLCHFPSIQTGLHHTLGYRCALFPSASDGKCLLEIR